MRGARKKNKGPDSEAETLMATTKRLREDLGLTQEAMSAELGVALYTIQRWEKSRAPRGKSLKMLLDYATQKGRPHYAEAYRRARIRHMGATLPTTGQLANYAIGDREISPMNRLEEAFIAGIVKYLRERTDRAESIKELDTIGRIIDLDWRSVKAN